MADSKNQEMVKTPAAAGKETKSSSPGAAVKIPVTEARSLESIKTLAAARLRGTCVAGAKNSLLSKGMLIGLGRICDPALEQEGLRAIAGTRPAALAVASAVRARLWADHIAAAANAAAIDTARVYCLYCIDDLSVYCAAFAKKPTFAREYLAADCALRDIRETMLGAGISSVSWTAMGKAPLATAPSSHLPPTTAPT